MPGKKKKRRAPLAEGPKACMQALRSLASLGVASGDSHAALRSPNLWPHEVHDDITAAWKALSANGEMPAHVASATLETLRGLPLVPGFKVRLPTAPDKDTHPTFIKGSGRNPAFLKLRDFTDSLVMATEATLARDATSAPLAKGKAKMPEQRALRQHLGVPAGPAAGKAQVSAADLRALFGDAGVNLAAERVAHLTAVVGGSLPDVPALVRSASQPVPYLEAERLLLTTLTSAAQKQMLGAARTPVYSGPASTAPPLPAWHTTYMSAAVKSDAAAKAGGEELQSLVEAEALPAERQPLSWSRDALEQWWSGEQARAFDVS